MGAVAPLDRSRVQTPGRGSGGGGQSAAFHRREPVAAFGTGTSGWGRAGGEGHGGHWAAAGADRAGAAPADHTSGEERFLRPLAATCHGKAAYKFGRASCREQVCPCMLNLGV